MGVERQRTYHQGCTGANARDDRYRNPSGFAAFDDDSEDLFSSVFARYAQSAGSANVRDSHHTLAVDFLDAVNGTRAEITATYGQHPSAAMCQYSKADETSKNGG